MCAFSLLLQGVLYSHLSSISNKQHQQCRFFLALNRFPTTITLTYSPVVVYLLLQGVLYSHRSNFLHAMLLVQVRVWVRCGLERCGLSYVGINGSNQHAQ